jgi:hypothetical protein
VLCCPERRREGGRGWPGKVPRSPAAHEEKREEKQADRKVPDRPVVVKGERLLKKKIKKLKKKKVPPLQNF